MQGPDPFRPPSGWDAPRRVKAVGGAEDWVPRARKRAIELVYVAAFVQGLAMNGAPAVRILTILALASAITLACMLDAEMHDKLFLRSYAWALMWTWPVGTLAHLIWTRGSVGIGLYVIHLFGFIAASLAGAFAGSLLSGF